MVIRSFSLFFDENPFLEIEHKINAEFKEWVHDDLRNTTIPDFDVQLQKTGIEVEMKNIVILENGLFSYEDRHVVIYIKDTGNRRETLENSPEDSMKYHLVDCKTIQDMKQKNRFARNRWDIR